MMSPVIVALPSSVDEPGNSGKRYDTYVETHKKWLTVQEPTPTNEILSLLAFCRKGGANVFSTGESDPPSDSDVRLETVGFAEHLKGLSMQELRDLTTIPRKSDGYLQIVTAVDMMVDESVTFFKTYSNNYILRRWMHTYSKIEPNPTPFKIVTESTMRCYKTTLKQILLYLVRSIDAAVYQHPNADIIKLNMEQKDAMYEILDAINRDGAGRDLDQCNDVLLRKLGVSIDVLEGIDMTELVGQHF
ncbi:hypothetical protein K440DRAFT_681210 [Wilcoxina mikolae CBS 423.85]|nr:hypothetical protein K440DRAFT_681210 [Wilcoxina mikolae CBS 423.85]